MVFTSKLLLLLLLLILLCSVVPFHSDYIIVDVNIEVLAIL